VQVIEFQPYSKKNNKIKKKKCKQYTTTNIKIKKNQANKKLLIPKLKEENYLDCRSILDI
jgi:hypothetical protein